MYRTFLIVALLSATVLCGAVSADEVELLSGSKMKGKFVSETDTAVKFKISVGGTYAQTTIRKKRIHAITVGYSRRVINARPTRTRKPRRSSTPKRGSTSSGKKTTAATDKALKRSRRQIEQLIARSSKAKPTWWDSVQLTYPQSLKLDFSRPPKGGWNNQTYIGPYVWDVINPNKGKWREGIKFLHFVRTTNQRNRNSTGQQRATESLASAYRNFLEDWPRAIYYWRQVGRDDTPSAAACYLKMGNRDWAASILRRYSKDNSRYGRIALLWAEMGDNKTALRMAGTMSGRWKHSGFMVSGDIYRRMGDYKRALASYQQAEALINKNANLRKGRDPARVRNALQAIKVFGLLDLRKIRDGSYSDKAQGYSGDVNITVTVKRGKIVDLKIGNHREKQYYSSLVDTPRQIIAKQDLKNVDFTTGATLTSQAITNATATALAQGRK